MKLIVHWHPAALSVFYRLPMHSATRMDRAVILFAETGQGQIEWVAPYYRLRAGGFDVAVAIDRGKRTLTVLRVHRGRT